jgi:OOP family OmpA-OmpF porin
VADISQVLDDVNRNYSIEGHTDAVGSVTYNKKLSLDRAETVARELEKHGLPGEKMRVRGFGEGYPVATNNSDIGRARNRRVEVIVENF